MDTSSFDELDFFTSRSLVADPDPYFDHLREGWPVQREPHHDVVMVNGYDEAAAIFSDPTTFSSCNALTGPFPSPVHVRREVLRFTM